MDISQIFSHLMIIVAVLIVLVNIITEVIKKVFDMKDSKVINIFVTLLSIILTCASFCMYWQIKTLCFTWYYIVAFIIVGFMVAYGAMFGYDKLISYFKDIKK